MGPSICMTNRWGKTGSSDRLYFLGLQITVDGDYSHKIKTLVPERKAMTNLDNLLKSKDITVPTNLCIVNSSFSSSHVQM